MMYNKLVESYFFKPKHVGVVDLSKDLSVFYRNGEVGRGDVFELSLLGSPKGLILEARFKAYGNPYLIAAAEWLCRLLDGSEVNALPSFDYVWLVQELDIPKTRYSIALQIEDAYQEIILRMKRLLKGETNE